MADEVPSEQPQAEETVAPKAGPSVGERFSAIASGVAKVSWFSYQTGRCMLVTGLLLVFFAKGCDSVGERGVERAGAKRDYYQNQFSDDWDQQEIAAAKKIKGIEEDIEAEEEEDEVDEKKVEGLEEDLEESQDAQKDLAKKRAKAEEEYEMDDGLDLDNAARDARNIRAMDAWWSGMLFVIGSLVLVFGLIVVSSTGSDQERKICLLMLVIIVFSIYVGGISFTVPR